MDSALHTAFEQSAWSTLCRHFCLRFAVSKSSSSLTTQRMAHCICAGGEDHVSYTRFSSARFVYPTVAPSVAALRDRCFVYALFLLLRKATRRLSVTVFVSLTPSRSPLVKTWGWNSCFTFLNPALVCFAHLLFQHSCLSYSLESSSSLQVSIGSPCLPHERRDFGKTSWDF